MDWDRWSEEAEVATLGSCITSEDALTSVVDILHGEEFYHSHHRDLYRALVALYRESAGIDPITVAEQMKKSGTFDRCGGYKFISKFVDLTYEPTNVREYAKRVRDKYVERRVVEVCDKVVADATNSKYENVSDLIEMAENELFNVGRHTREESILKVSETINSTMDILADRINNPDASSGVLTGFRKIDKMTNGLKPGQLILVAGRPSMGKTSLAMNIATSASIMHDTGVAIFSLEMSRDELQERMIAAEGEVDSQKLKRGMLADWEFKHIAEAVGLINSAPLYIDDSPSITPMGMKAKLRKLMLTEKIDLAIVDYIQLMDSDAGGKKGNRQEEISEISRRLKLIARELEIPIIAISQLSRAPEARDNPRPILSDLRESGALEQNADIVIFVFREEYYTGPTNREGRDVRGLAEILISKHRNGPTGKALMRFVNEYTRFKDET